MELMFHNVKRRGMTLFEVAISLALVAATVTVVAGLFPLGLRAQMHARFRLYAAAKAVEIADSFASSHNINSDIDAEASAPWDVAVGYRCLAPDLEIKLSSHRFGIMPLPLAIARRLDCDGDEIARLLERGAYLYYAQPMATSNLDNKALGAFPPNEAQKLVFAIAGHAQHNALHILPWKAWPYFAIHPSPPLHAYHAPAHLPPGTPQFGNGFSPTSVYCWETIADPSDTAMRVVFDWNEPSDGQAYGFKPYAYDNAPDEARAVRYLQATLWYCARLGLPASFYAPTSNAVGDALTTFVPGTVPPHKQVQAMRFLAHAAMCLTRWRSALDLGGSPSLGSGLAIPSVTLDGQPSPAIDLSHDRIVWYAESCHALAMIYAASFPYDWGAPRPLERATMMDCALIEWDLFTTPLSGAVFDPGAPLRAARQWRALPATPISNLGRSFQCPDRDIGDIWGDPAHVTLTAPFSAEERCRQLVFWAVDWQAYEDCETSPSAPLDASKYPIAQPVPGVGFDARMRLKGFCDPLLFSFRNPEKSIVFHESVAALATGADITALVENVGSGVDTVWDVGADRAARFCGVHGADRDADKRLDRGPLPAAARLRAQLVARYNLYDPRVPTMIR